MFEYKGHAKYAILYADGRRLSVRSQELSKQFGTTQGWF